MRLRGALPGLGTLGGAVAVAGVAGYALLVVCGRLLEPADFAVLLAYWGLVFGLGGVASSLEQEVARSTAVARREGRSGGRELRRTLGTGLVVAGLLGAPLLVPGVAGRLLAGQDRLGPLVLAVTLGHTVQFCVRGVLLGQDRVPTYASLFVAEALVRVLVAVGLGVLHLAGVVPLAVAIGLGGFVWLAAPGVLGRALRQPGDPGEDRGSAVTVRRVLALMAGALLTASVVTGYPALVSALVPELRGAALGTFFAALTVSRAPLLVVAPLQTVTVPTLVRLLGAPGGRTRVRRLLLLGAGVVLLLAVAGAAVGALLGPGVVRLLYGAAYDPAPLVVAALVASAVLLAGLMLSTASLVALESHGWVPVAWGLASGVSALTLVLAPGGPVTRATAGLVAGPIVGLSVALLRARYAAGDRPEPIVPVRPGGSAEL